MQGGKREKSNMKHSRGQQMLDTFGALPGSIYAYCMSFRSLRSQQSNALNDARFGVEMKKLEPLEADHMKLRANFAACEITRGWLRNQPLAEKWCPLGCEISQPSCTPAKSS